MTNLPKPTYIFKKCTYHAGNKDKLKVKSETILIDVAVDCDYVSLLSLDSCLKNEVITDSS